MKLYWNNPSFFGYAVLGLLFLRGFLNGILPLMDKTEARYAEISRIMQETQNWITPQIDYGVPFWAKPPLSTWLSALSFELFGVNEFAARLPYLILAVMLIFLVGKYAQRAKLPFFLPGFVLLTLPEFFLHAGVVSTDTALAFCIALIMLSFWEMMQEYAKWYWKPLFFIGLGLGLLTKGPITALLALPPIVFWVLFHGKAVTTLKRMPLLFGAILTLGIALPWYAAAERNTPGFLDYFFIGEHFKRFFDSEWAGDKYGFPKSQPLGAIWWFLIVFALPWILFVLGKLWKEHKRIRKNEWVLFLVFWLLWTPLFFTFSKSLIHPYIMPVTTPIALLATYWFSTLKRKGIVVKTTLSLTFLVSIVVLMATHLGYTAYYAPTDKYLIQEHTWHGDVIYHLHSKSYSSQFYSKGRIRSVPLSDLNEKIHNDQEAFKIIITHGQMGNLPEKVQNKLQLLGQNNRKGIYGFKGRFP